MGKTHSDMEAPDHEFKPATNPDVIFNKEHYPDIVLFTGAGASRAEPMALPTMEEFFAQFTQDEHGRHVEETLPGSSPFISKEVAGLLTQLLSIVDKTPKAESGHPDLEDVLGILQSFINVEGQSAENLLRGMPLFDSYRNNSFSDNPKEARERSANYQERFTNFCDIAARAQKVIYSLLYDAYGHVKTGKPLATYGPLIWALLEHRYDMAAVIAGNQPHMAVFTTNYDLSFEIALRDLIDPEPDNKLSGGGVPHVTFSNGFPWEGNHRRRKWALANYNESLSHEDYDGPGQPLISYFKLHGSLNWRRENGTIFDVDLCEESRTPGHGPVLIYPGLTKEAPTETPFKEAYANLREALKHANACGIIGFAMRDECIKNIFEEALKVNPQLRIVVFQPEPLPEAYSEWRETYGDKQLQWINGKFGDDEATVKFGLELATAAMISDRRRRHVVTGPQKASASE